MGANPLRRQRHERLLLGGRVGNLAELNCGGGGVIGQKGHLGNAAAKSVTGLLMSASRSIVAGIAMADRRADTCCDLGIPTMDPSVSAVWSMPDRSIHHSPAVLRAARAAQGFLAGRPGAIRCRRVGSASWRLLRRRGFQRS